MRGKGRPKKDFSEKLENKLFNIMLRNHDALFDFERLRGPPSNVTEVLAKLKQKGISISRRALNKRLGKLWASGILGKKKIRKEVFYYCKTETSPGFFWERTIKAFIDKMIKEEGSSAWGYTFIGETPTHYYALDHKAVILEDGLDITSKLDWEEYPRDVIGEILHLLEDKITKEIVLRVRLDPEKIYTQEEAIRVMREYFENKKLAFVYVLDGSKFEVLDREKMGGPWKPRETKEK